MNKRSLILGGIISGGLAIAMGSGSASASLLLYEGFDYTSGQLLAPTNDTSGSPNPGLLNTAYSVNWRYAGNGNASTQKPPSVASDGLSYSGFAASTGLSAAYDTTQLGSARIGFANQNAGTVYWSALLRVNDVSNLNTVNGILLGGFNNSADAGTLPSVYGQVLRIRGVDDTDHYQVGTGLNSGTGSGAGGANVQFESTSRLEGGTILIVGSYEFVSGSNNDIARLWINPDSADFGAVTAPAASLTSAPGVAIADPVTNVTSFDLRNVNTVGTPNVQIDELRIGTSWADVTAVPEPMGLAGVAAFGLLAFRRRRV